MGMIVNALLYTIGYTDSTLAGIGVVPECNTDTPDSIFDRGYWNTVPDYIRVNKLMRLINRQHK